MIQTQKIEKTDKEEIVSEVTIAVTAVMRGMFVEFGGAIDKKIDALAEATNKGFAEVHGRIDNVENKLETLESRVGSLDEKIEDLRGDMNENFGKVRNDIFILHDTGAAKEEVKKIAFRVTKLERSAI